MTADLATASPNTHTASDGDVWTRASRRRALRSAGAPLDALTAALSDPDPAIRRAALTNPQCPADLLATAIECDPDPDVRAAGVLAVWTFTDLPADISDSPHWEVRRALAQRADCPTPLLRSLALGDRYYEVRRTALVRDEILDAHLLWAVFYGRRGLDAELLVSRCASVLSCVDKIAGIPHESVRAAIAWRRDCPSQLLARLGLTDSSPTVRQRAVEHRTFPSELLAAVLTDPDFSVRTAAVCRDDFPHDLMRAAATDASYAVRLATLGHKTLDPVLVEALAGDASTDVREAACEHVNCPPAALGRGADDVHADVRLAAVRHRRCPAEAVAAACQDADLDVRAAALAHPAAVAARVAWQALKDAERVLRGPGDGQEPDPRHQVIRREALRRLMAAPWPDLAALPIGRERAELSRS